MATEGRNLSQEIDDLKTMMFEQGAMFKEAFEIIRKSKEGDGNNNDDANNSNAILQNEEGNECKITREMKRLKLKEELEESMQEQFRALRGPNPYGPMSINDLCLAPNVTIPKDFKMPEFIKFDGSINPIMHLRMYCTKMGIWSKDENFLISFFPESLDGAAWEWYMQMDQTQIRCWEDLAQAFTNQYKFNLNAAPTRDQLKGIRKKENESFKEYAQRWRAMAGRVVPPMLEQETCSYFIRTLKGPFFKNMLGTHVKEFVDLVEIGERIEANIQERKVEIAENDLQSEQGTFYKQKEDAVNSVQAHHPSQSYKSTFQPNHDPPYQYSHHPPSRPYQYLHHPPYQYVHYPPSRHCPFPTHYSPQPYQVNHISSFQPHAPIKAMSHQTLSPNHQRTSFNTTIPKPSRHSRPLPNFKVSNSELFKNLCHANLLAPRPAGTATPPYPHWFNPNCVCEYHSDTLGHSIDECKSFRDAVWDLIDAKAIEVQDQGAEEVPVESSGA